MNIVSFLLFLCVSAHFALSQSVTTNAHIMKLGMKNPLKTHMGAHARAQSAVNVLKAPSKKPELKKAAPSKKAELKKSPVKKASLKKSSVKKPELKKAPVKKPELKKAPVKKPELKKAAPSKKASLKKSPVKKILKSSQASSDSNEETFGAAEVILSSLASLAVAIFGASIYQRIKRKPVPPPPAEKEDVVETDNLLTLDERIHF